MNNIDLVIIGGGSAGMAAAIKAKQEGIDDILIIEKDDNLGGILNQCIHNGFGLTEFKEELTGPEYLSRFAKQVEELGIKVALNTMVIDLTEDKIVTISNKDGVSQIKAKAIIIATGCYERGAGAIQIPGDRCAGIITAGTAQKYLNIYGYMVGKKVVILGSGDIGLIMARRLTLEGAKVICVSEIMPYSNGLNRNIAQCLNDYDIPLYLSRSVSKVEAKDGRLAKVTLSAVDDNFNFIPGSEMEIECDTLILSVGLIPYISLLNYINCPISSTKGAKVNEYMETMIEGIFSCGNCLHVHDVVDFVSDEGRLAGHGAALYIKNQLPKGKDIKVTAKEGISYVVPQVIHDDVSEDVTFKFRVKKPVKDVFLVVESNNKVITKVVKPVLIPSEMVMVKISLDKLKDLGEEISFRLEEK